MRQSLSRASQTRRRIAVGLGVLGALVVALLISASLGTDLLWFGAIGFRRVILTQWIARVVLFVLGFLLMGGSVYAAIRAAYRARPATTYQAPVNPLGPASLASYREVVEPLRRGAMFGVPVVLGLIAGLSVSAAWRQVLLALYGTPFGIPDPQFGLDLGFYIFVLPALRAVAGLAFAAVAAALVASAAVHYLYGGLVVGRRGSTRAARRQLGWLAAGLLVVVAARIWLDRYSLLSARGERFDGASYTDVHAVIPSRSILAVVCLLVAATFVAAVLREQWKLPLIGMVLLIVSAAVIGAAYPAIVQRFQVTPNAQELEEPYIQRNIDATLVAFGLDGVEKRAYDAKTTAEPGALRQDAETTASIRLLDPQIIAPSFRQLQQNWQYYNFADQLSVDRYLVGGQSRDTVIAVRELNLAGLGASQRNWVNDHTVFTHGYGVVAAFGNQIGPDGRPAFFEGGIPTQGELTDTQAYEPRIYFSPGHLLYSVVGAPPGTDPWELDFQADSPDAIADDPDKLWVASDEGGGGQVNRTFPTDEVVAGPSIGTWWRKLLFAVKFGDEQLLFSDRVNPYSQILYERDPRARVARVAPWLTLDNRVYPAVVDGRVLWIIDAYTTTNEYPYAASVALEPALQDSQTPTLLDRSGLLAPTRLNYLRNSIKATVDAYDGSVTLYAWEPQDPLLQTWERIFPGSVTPMSEISGDLMSHLRYPEDMFKVQRTLLQRYHVTNAAEFFSGQDFWQIPPDPAAADAAIRALQPPYYLTLKMPGQDEAAFSLTSTFIPGGNSDREILTGFLAADAEAGSQAGVRAPGYGQLRLLAMPRDNTVPGPGQVRTNFNTNPTISQQLNVLEIGSSEVIRGNQLTLPVGGGLLYVQPVYIQSATGTQFPLLRKVLVAFGDSIGFADTLEGALDQVFGDADTAPTTPPPANEPVTSGNSPTTDAGAPAPGELDARTELAAALREARSAMADGQNALRDGDFGAYGEALQRLQDALTRAADAEARLE